MGVTLGDVLQVSDFSPFGPPFPAEEEGCAPSPEFGYYGPGSAFNTPPFDPTAPAEARAFVQLNMVFTFEASGS